MTIQTAFAILGIVFWIAAQYGLAAAALSDLRRENAPAAGNPVTWALLILCLPVAGPLLYFRQARAAGLPERRRARPVIPPVKSSRRNDGPDPDWPWDDGLPPVRGRE